MSLILLTPIGLDAACWDGLGAAVDGAIRHEWPGLGGRPAAAGAPTMESLADEVAAGYAGTLDVVGVSMGGMVGQHVAIRHPDRVRSLLVACTGASADPRTMHERARATEANGMAGVLADTLERWFTPEALARRPEHPGVAYARRTLLALPPERFADGWRAIAGHDARARLDRIGAVTTCVAGDADRAASVERVGALAAGIAGARLEVVPGPHMLHLEQPAGFAQALRRHRERVQA